LLGRCYKGDVAQVWRRWAAVAGCLDGMFQKVKGVDAKLSGITLRAPDAGNDSWLLIARGSRKSGRIVAFHRGRSAADCVEDFAIRVAQGKVDWREDRPLTQGGDGGDESSRTDLPALPVD